LASDEETPLFVTEFFSVSALAICRAAPRAARQNCPSQLREEYGHNRGLETGLILVESSCWLIKPEKHTELDQSPTIPRE
jgi:hypothetical protein